MMKNEKGFGVVEILIILVIVGLISGVGWYIWQSKNNNSNERPKTQTQEQMKQQVTPSPSSNPSTSSPASTQVQVTDYQSCVKAGGVTNTSLAPSSCVYAGKTYTDGNF